MEWSIRLKIVVEGVGATSYDARHPITGIDKETSPNPKGTLLKSGQEMFWTIFRDYCAAFGGIKGYKCEGNVFPDMYLLTPTKDISWPRQSRGTDTITQCNLLYIVLGRGPDG